MGCNIKWVSKRKVVIKGVRNINQLSYQVMPDRIEAGTYLVAAALTEGNLKIKNVIQRLLVQK